MNFKVGDEVIVTGQYERGKEFTIEAITKDYAGRGEHVAWNSTGRSWGQYFSNIELSYNPKDWEFDL